MTIDLQQSHLSLGEVKHKSVTASLSIDDDRREETLAEAVTRLLLMRHPAPTWAAFSELRVGTGFSGAGRIAAEQRLDVFALHTWPSEKFRTVIYEVKVSRSDFMRELAQPRKRTIAEELGSECFFATPAGLVLSDEVPEGWGLIEMNAGGLRVKKAALQRAPVALPMYVVASIARRSAETRQESKALWTCAGRDVDEATLLKIAEERFNLSVESERVTLEREGMERFRESAEYQELAELRDAVKEAMGSYNWTAERFREWAREERQSQASKWLLRDLKQAHAGLGSLLEKLQGGEQA